MTQRGEIQRAELPNAPDHDLTLEVRLDSTGLVMITCVELPGFRVSESGPGSAFSEVWNVIHAMSAAGDKRAQAIVSKANKPWFEKRGRGRT